MSRNVPFEAFVVGMCLGLIIGLLAGAATQDYKVKREAIDAGAAEYRLVTNTTAKVELVWKKGQQ